MTEEIKDLIAECQLRIVLANTTGNKGLREFCAEMKDKLTKLLPKDTSN